ncbi:MAG: hypothetical protein JSU70_19510 [Phycisphaerales bacterium]|nr:MAG: hypothetical protein JSU70_19510 [Phycisphaerales bacterium]
MQRSITILFLCTLVVLGLAVSPCEAQQESVKGELRLEGERISRLVLRLIDSSTKKGFDRPGETIELLPGQYEVLQSRLEGGYVSHYPDVLSFRSIEIEANEPAVLKVGAPLRQALQVQRQGRLLLLEYELVGVGGERYTSAGRDKPPRFTVYRGERQITSGKLEYG